MVVGLLRWRYRRVITSKEMNWGWYVLEVFGDFNPTKNHRRGGKRDSLWDFEWQMTTHTDDDEKDWHCVFCVEYIFIWTVYEYHNTLTTWHLLQYNKITNTAISNWNFISHFKHTATLLDQLVWKELKKNNCHHKEERNWRVDAYQEDSFFSMLIYIDS